MGKHVAFIFDLEGVLIDHLERQCEIATKALASIGVPVKVTRDVYQLRSENAFHITKDFLAGLYAIHTFKLNPADVKRNPQGILDYVARLDASDRAKVDRAVQTFDSLRTTGRGIKAGTPRHKRVAAMLRFLEKKGIPFFLVTAGKKVDADRFMKEAGLIRFFQNRSYYGEDQIKKGPLFKQVIEKYGLEPDGTYVVEDSLSGIKEAHGLGLRTIGVLTGNTSNTRFTAMIQRGELPPTHVMSHAKRIRGGVVPTAGGQILRAIGKGMQRIGLRRMGTALRNRYAPKTRSNRRR